MIQWKIISLSVLFSISCLAAESQYKVISVEQVAKLKTIRDSYAPIKGLDKVFKDKTHKNGIPYHIFTPKVSGKVPLVMFLHGNTDLTIDTPKLHWPLVVLDYHDFRE